MLNKLKFREAEKDLVLLIWGMNGYIKNNSCSPHLGPGEEESLVKLHIAVFYVGVK